MAFPELEQACADLERLAAEPRTRLVLEQTEHLLAGTESIPQTSYSTYRLFRKSGERSRYEAGYFLENIQTRETRWRKSNNGKWTWPKDIRAIPIPLFKSRQSCLRQSQQGLLNLFLSAGRPHQQ